MLATVQTMQFMVNILHSVQEQVQKWSNLQDELAQKVKGTKKKLKQVKDQKTVVLQEM